MSDENLMGGLDSGESIRTDINKVTEEDIRRVQEDTRQARQIQAQIKKDKAINNQFAKFLQFLLKTLKNEDLISALYKTFFIVTNQKTGTKYYKKQINNVVIVGFFAPFFRETITEYNLQSYYDDIKINGNITISNYVDYIRRLSKKHHDNIPIDKDSLLNLLCYIIVEFGLTNNALSDQSSVLTEIRQALTHH